MSEIRPDGDDALREGQWLEMKNGEELDNGEKAGRAEYFKWSGHDACVKVEGEKSDYLLDWYRPARPENIPAEHRFRNTIPATKAPVPEPVPEPVFVHDDDVCVWTWRAIQENWMTGCCQFPDELKRGTRYCPHCGKPVRVEVGR